MAVPCPVLPGHAEPLVTQPRALPNLSLKEQPQIGCVKGGKKTRFKAWLYFKAVEDITAVQQLAARFRGNQDKPAPGVFASICSLARTSRRDTAERRAGLPAMGARTLPGCRRGSRRAGVAVGSAVCPQPGLHTSGCAADGRVSPNIPHASSPATHSPGCSWGRAPHPAPLAHPPSALPHPS